MFSLVQLRVFVTAARAGSFTGAAAELHMAQPSVSEFVRRLEDEYGTRLFVRGGRRLVLTEAGETLLTVAVKVTGSADEADRTLRAITSLEGGTASFGLLRNAKYYRLEALLTQFHQRYPSVRLRIVGLNSVEVAAAVTEGELEAGLVVLPIDADGLTVTTLSRDEVLYTTADPEHALHPPTIEDLASRKLVLYDAHYGWRDPTRRQVLERASLAGVHLDPIVEVEQVESALSLVAAGVGDSFVSRAVAESDSCPPGLYFVPFADPLYDTIALVQRIGAVLSPATAEIVRLARAML